MALVDWPFSDLIDVILGMRFPCPVGHSGTSNMSTGLADEKNGHGGQHSWVCGTNVAKQIPAAGAVANSFKSLPRSCYALACVLYVASTS